MEVACNTQVAVAVSLPAEVVGDSIVDIGTGFRCSKRNHFHVVTTKDVAAHGGGHVERKHSADIMPRVQGQGTVFSR